MMRTTLYLPETLHQRLLIASKRLNSSISQIAQQLLDAGLSVQENAQSKAMYDALEKVKGVCKDPLTDASTTLNAVLYGENGAWRGTMPSKTHE